MSGGGVLKAAIAPVLASVKKKKKHRKLNYTSRVLEEHRSIGFTGKASKGFDHTPPPKISG